MRKTNKLPGKSVAKKSVTAATVAHGGGISSPAKDSTPKGASVSKRPVSGSAKLNGK